MLHMGARIKDKASGEFGKVVAVGTGLVRVWLMDSDSEFWRTAEELEIVSGADYDQACFEWEIVHNA